VAGSRDHPLQAAVLGSSNTIMFVGKSEAVASFPSVRFPARFLLIPSSGFCCRQVGASQQCVVEIICLLLVPPRTHHLLSSTILDELSIICRLTGRHQDQLQPSLGQDLFHTAPPTVGKDCRITIVYYLLLLRPCW